MHHKVFTFKPLLLAKYKSFIDNKVSYSEKVSLSESGEKYAQIKYSLQEKKKTVLYKTVGVF